MDESIDRRSLFFRVAALTLGAGALRNPDFAIAGEPAQAQQGASRPVLLRPGDGTRGVVGGNRVQFKLTRQQTGGAFATLEGNLAPGRMGAPPHRHKGIDEIARVLDGELTVLVEDELFRVPAGGWHLRPRGQIHSFWNAGPKSVRFIEMYLPGAHEAYMRDLTELLARDSTPPSATLDALARRHDIEFFWDRLPPILREHRVRL